MQQHSSRPKTTTRGSPILLARSRRERGASRRQRDGGYLLLAIMLMMAFMVISFAYVVGPAVVQQMKRDREEEMIHRGTEYARAIKKFYKKNGRYPASLDDLDKGQIRYLRKRYTDPLSKDGKWKLLRYGDIQALLSTTGPGVPAGALGQQGGALTPGGAVVPGAPPAGGGNSTFGFGSQQTSPQPIQQQQQFQGPGAVVGFPSNSDQGSNQEGVPTNSFGGSTSPGGTGQQGSSGSDQTSASTGIAAAGATGLNTSANAQVIGGGAIVGVASKSKEKTIRIYNKKKTYDEWQFIYNPVMDMQNVLLRGPYQPTMIGNTNIGTPAGQLNGQQGQQNSPFGQQNNNGFGQQNNGFGQQNSGFGQQSSSFGQQQNYPPVQNQQH
jgi:type II secretory pathway pseudopilin PulG